MAGGSVQHSKSAAVEGMSKRVTLSREFQVTAKMNDAVSGVDKKAAADIVRSG